jgi:hypothetical protein
MLKPSEASEFAERSFALSRKIQPLLRGQPPGVQGAALADLVAIFFVGHDPRIRMKFMDAWLECVAKLIENSTEATEKERGKNERDNRRRRARPRRR